MSGRAKVLLIGFSLLASVASAAPGFDYKDYDDELMRDLEKTIKYFEPDITAQNADAAREDAAVLADGFRYTEDYFNKKGGAQDAVEISRKGSKLISQINDYIGKSDFDQAAAAARDATAVCKSCHDIYKPRLAR
ncbi:hypothetical protein [Methylocystis heyeri]|uniref:Cytochrome c n=1 Tax=Methylocystis heyeri TaxID=391905 RepID=A0A6B8KCZ2_9HYPH|nr:hypothetical protein [Methylocystis heyeri]QGM44398.1 hypothetical protein H2LOC_001055 [Methylocystis heyeri]